MMYNNQGSYQIVFLAEDGIFALQIEQARRSVIIKKIFYEPARAGVLRCTNIEELGCFYDAEKAESCINSLLLNYGLHYNIKAGKVDRAKQ